MSNKEYNNDYFSYEGVISRKNYTINMLILIVLLISLSLIRFDTIKQFVTYNFLYETLIFIVNFFKFVIVMSMLSVIYRRIADFSENKSIKFNLIMKRIFILLFVFPLLYFYCIIYFFNFSILFYTALILTFIGFIASIIFCFLK